MRSKEVKSQVTDLKRTAAELTAILGEMKQERNVFAGALHSLERMWDGEECAQFCIRVQNDLDRLDEEIRETEKSISYLQTAAERYCSCERGIEEIIADI